MGRLFHAKPLRLRIDGASLSCSELAIASPAIVQKSIEPSRCAKFGVRKLCLYRNFLKTPPFAQAASHHSNSATNKQRRNPISVVADEFQSKSSRLPLHITVNYDNRNSK